MKTILPTKESLLAFYWTVVFLFTSFFIFAQKPKLDSLRNEVKLALETKSDSAYVLAQRLFLVDSNSAISLALFANANYQINQPTVGDFYIKKLLGKDSLFFQALSLKAFSLLDRGDKARVDDVLQKLAVHYPNEAETHYLQAYFLFQNGQLKEAIEANNRALAIAPALSAALLLDAQLNFKNENFEKAAHGFQQQLTYIQNDPNVLNSYGVALLKIDKADEAIEILGRALSIDTQSSAILYNLGLAFLQTDNFSQARSCFEQQKNKIDTMPELDLLIAKCWIQERSLEKALASYQRFSERATQPSVQKEIGLIKTAIFLSKNWYWLLGAFTLAVWLLVFLLRRKTSLN